LPTVLENGETSQARYCVTVIVTVVECVMPPPVPLMVNTWAPSDAAFGTVIVRVDFPAPGAGMGFTLKDVAEAPDKVIAESKPLPTLVVIVEVPVLPLATVMALGEALMAKLALEAVVTVRVTVVVWLMPPPKPVTVMGYVPATVVEATAMVMVEVPEPGAAIDVGLKVTVTPAGWPVADKPMGESKPPETAVVIADVPLLPCTTGTAVGEAEML